jgi:hypothetical protein
VAKVAKIPTSRRTWVSSPTNIAKNFSQQTLNGGGVFGDAADPTCPADDPGSTGPAVLGAVVVAPPWKPLDEPRRAAMDIIIGSEDRLPTMRPTMASGRSEKASSDGGHSIPWICAIPTPHGERIEGLGVAPSPPPPREPRAGGGREPVRPWALFPKHRMLQTLLLATFHTQTRNIDANFSRWLLHGRRFATLNNLFRNIVTQHCTRAAPRSTADRGLHPDPAA